MESRWEVELEHIHTINTCTQYMSLYAKSTKSVYMIIISKL